MALCCIFLAVFIVSMFVINCVIIESSNRYCDGNVGVDPKAWSTGPDSIVSNCIQCPEHARCEYGRAWCLDAEDVLHPTKGCLPIEQYAVQMNADKLYAKLVELLKHKRRLSINHCGTAGLNTDSDHGDRNESALFEDYSYVMDGGDIWRYFKDKQQRGYLGMDAREMEQAMILMFKRLDTDRGGDIRRDRRGVEGYVAVVPQWEYESHQNCTKLNMLMVARTFGLELTLSVVSVTVLFVSWRKMTTESNLQ